MSSLPSTTASNQLEFRKLCFLFLGAISLLLFIKLGSWGVIETSEARYAQISKEMYESKDFIHPKMLGILHYHKPPFIYWITSLSYAIFGVTEFAARFFLQLAYLLQIVLIYKVAMIIFADRKVSLYTTVIYATFPMVLISIRGLTTDAYVTTLILGSILSWLSFIKYQKPAHIYLTALLLSIGFLTKGPVPWIYVGCVMIGTISLVPDFKKYWWHYLISIMIMIPISFSWYAFIITENKALREYFLIHHTVERFTNGNSFKRAEPWWFYLASLPALMLTWLIVLITGAIKNKIPSMPLVLKRIAIFWVTIPFIFFSVASSKLILYILPLFGGLAIVSGYYLSKENLGKAAENIFVGLLLLLNLIFAIAPFFENIISLPSWIGIVPLVALLLILLIRYKTTIYSIGERLCLYAMIFTVSLIPFSTVMLSQNNLLVNAIKPVSTWIQKQELTHKKILVYNELLPSLAFDLGHKNIISLYDGNHSAMRETQFEENAMWKENWIDLTSNQTIKVDVKNTILLAKKGKFKDRSQWILTSYKQQKEIGKWIVYY
jgi:4-amino-4-deoxy-L-arabinose transferase-like glycosyltransferase